MNPYGTTRQSVGGQNHYEPKVGRTWYDVIPFRPCRPPTPEWIIDWPLEQLSRVASYLLMFSACRDAALLQDPRSGIIPGLLTPSIPALDTGPSANPIGFTGTLNPTGTRIWYGRARGAGAGLRTIAVSPMFTGPARITSIIFATTGLAGGGGATLRDSFGIGVGTATPVVDGARASNQPSGFTVFDSSMASDQPNEQLPIGTPTNLNTFFTTFGIHPILMNVKITLTQFQIWVALDTNSVNASSIEVYVTIEQEEQTASGITQSLYTPPPTWSRSYIG